MRKLKIYLSGAITGRENYKEEFEYAKIRIKDFEAKNNKKTDKEKIKLDIDKKPELLMLKALRMDKVCYSDNLTGSDFSKVIEKLKMC